MGATRLVVPLQTCDVRGRASDCVRVLVRVSVQVSVWTEPDVRRARVGERLRACARVGAARICVTPTTTPSPPGVVMCLVRCVCVCFNFYFLPNECRAARPLTGVPRERGGGSRSLAMLMPWCLSLWGTPAHRDARALGASVEVRVCHGGASPP